MWTGLAPNVLPSSIEFVLVGRATGDVLAVLYNDAWLVPNSGQCSIGGCRVGIQRSMQSSVIAKRLFNDKWQLLEGCYISLYAIYERLHTCCTAENSFEAGEIKSGSYIEIVIDSCEVHIDSSFGDALNAGRIVMTSLSLLEPHTGSASS